MPKHRGRPILGTVAMILSLATALAAATAARFAPSPSCISPGSTDSLPATNTLSDRWTVVTLDGSLSAHFEHTIAITENGTRVLTRLDDVAPAAAA